jgi:hypothetical protein
MAVLFRNNDQKTLRAMQENLATLCSDIQRSTLLLNTRLVDFDLFLNELCKPKNGQTNPISNEGLALLKKYTRQVSYKRLQADVLGEPGEVGHGDDRFQLSLNSLKTLKTIIGSGFTGNHYPFERIAAFYKIQAEHPVNTMLIYTGSAADKRRFTDVHNVFMKTVNSDIDEPDVEKTTFLYLLLCMPNCENRTDNLMNLVYNTHKCNVHISYIMLVVYFPLVAPDSDEYQNSTDGADVPWTERRMELFDQHVKFWYVSSDHWDWRESKQ